MKTSNIILSVISAASIAGVAFPTLNDQLSADSAFAALVIIALSAFAIYDYSRNTSSVRPPARILRPTTVRHQDSMQCDVCRAA